MFDALKRGLAKFTKGATEAVKDEPAPKAAPAPKAQPAAEPAPAARPQVPRPEGTQPAAATRPAAAPAAKPPTVGVGRHDPATKTVAAHTFDSEVSRAASAAPGATPEHAVQGAEFEEGNRAKVPTPRGDHDPRAPRGPPAAPHEPFTAPSSREPDEAVGLQGGLAPPASIRRPEPTPQPVSTPRPATAPPPPSVPSTRGKAIDPAKVKDLLWDLELALLESDVAMGVVEEIRARLEARLPEIRVAKSEDVPAAIEGALRDALRAVLGNKLDWDAWLAQRLAAKRPLVIMFVGVNGTGKTTTIGRVAHRLKEDGFSCIMAAGDTFRAGAIEQLSKHGENLGISVIKTQPGGDPAAVAYDAIEAAKARKKDVVLLDTAGRMQTNTNLMDEMKKIKRVAQPDMIVFVGDSLAGNDAVEQARKFDEAVGIDAAILTKVDTDAKGGAALSIAHAVGKPLLFIGVGQDYGDLIPYDPEWMVQRIFES